MENGKTEDMVMQDETMDQCVTEWSGCGKVLDGPPTESLGGLIAYLKESVAELEAMRAAGVVLEYDPDSHSFRLVTTDAEVAK